MACYFPATFAFHLLAVPHMSLAAQMLLNRIQHFTEPLEVRTTSRSHKNRSVSFTLAIDRADQMLIGGTGFLFSCHILGQIGNRIAQAGDVFCCPRYAINISPNKP